MHLHHLNCVTMCPPGGRLMDGRARASGPAKLACRCVLVELRDRLVLVDTGFGLNDVRAPEQRLSPFFHHVMCRPQLRESDTAVRQIEALGFGADDVTDILLTHLDFDHAGGLDDFPRARVHLLESERVAAEARRWVTYPDRSGEDWRGFGAVRQIGDLPPELLFVPLQGHTTGHAGIAVQNGDRWLLHAGDAYFHQGELDSIQYRCPPGLRFYQWFMEVDRRQRLENQRRLRDLVKRERGAVQIVCAHDLGDLEAMQGGERARERRVAEAGRDAA